MSERMTEEALTPAQRALLGRVRSAGEVRLSGRARKPVEALAKAGFITYRFDLVPHSGKWTERYTVWPASKGVVP